mmetsp:Transcript_41176/g.86188  ORF Transcript_41176/g.86188 Transcript_41176/m.86188 type:complete len:218 (-) Transcript_41176:226-879(-)
MFGACAGGCFRRAAFEFWARATFRSIFCCGGAGCNAPRVWVNTIRASVAAVRCDCFSPTATPSCAARMGGLLRKHALRQVKSTTATQRSRQSTMTPRASGGRARGMSLPASPDTSPDRSPPFAALSISAAPSFSLPLPLAESCASLKTRDVFGETASISPASGGEREGGWDGSSSSGTLGGSMGSEAFGAKSGLVGKKGVGSGWRGYAGDGNVGAGS